MRTFTIILLALTILLSGIAPANAGIFGKKKKKVYCAAYGRNYYSPFGHNQTKKVKQIKKHMKSNRSRFAMSEKTGMPLAFAI